ncbi:oligopeptide/dipeptide ABC transporter ATP-binding protein [Caballeronia mineralivorans]|uniref:oligopeptide/dipeptide ABC transporter ATP-binding protein n=1 Tax=Caballeronia mineralivorans TaxID=2010198 RepID=UPI0023F114A4|nr:oligopeptide/dipeptide ABC transporter ATP-binding protein [Caballeronia mineralivorans]
MTLARSKDAYPHQLSGGMQQRVIIAMALAKEPSLLVLDEPTTGLDATVEAGVIDLIAHLRQEFGTSVLFISHSLAVVARLCDRVGVLYAGTLVEEGPARDVLDSPHHPYTVGLLRCLPRAGFRNGRNRLETIQGFLPPIGAALPGCVFADRCALADERCRTRSPEMVRLDATRTEAGADRRSRCYYVERAVSMLMSPPVPGPAATEIDRSGPPVLRALNLSKTFVAGGHRVNALDNVSFDLWPGETLGLVGESGSGKSTLAKSMVGLSSFDDRSELQLRGEPLVCPTRKRRRDQIKAVQMVFQNPASAMNRSHSVRGMVGRALGRLAGLKGSARVASPSLPKG